jgi:hypothetical protein
LLTEYILSEVNDVLLLLATQGLSYIVQGNELSTIYKSVQSQRFAF